ncbi:MAG: ABC transporter permease [Synechococcales cyanobacterium T60_A2020_003]|nr:ABC transporter permease [Synechococcales cyanobacterium T60_A2020_003]
MNILVESYAYAIAHSDELLTAFVEHGQLVAIPLSIALILGIPLGFWSARSPLASQILTNGFNGLRVIPSIAILFLAIPYFGLSFQSAAIALTILAIPPILINTDVAFRTIDPTVREAAMGMGMNPAQRVQQIEIPLAFPVILAGIKTATVEVIASATLAAFIGAGGLGTFIVLGFSLYDNAVLLVGAIPVALLALSVEALLSLVHNWVQPPR